MNRHLHLMTLALAAVLLLAACSDPEPIAVYVTPTPLIVPTDTPTPALVPGDTALVNLQAQHTLTPQPTPVGPPPGVQFGPITGPEYTPEPLHTALPATVAVQQCQVSVGAPQLEVRAAPDASAAVVRVATERERLLVSQIVPDAAGVRWVQTPDGWLPLLQDGVEVAALADLWECDVLLGEKVRRTLLGFHVLNNRPEVDVLAFAQRLRAAGIVLGTVKGLNGAENLLNELERVSPETVTVYRSLLTPRGMLDCPPEVFEGGEPVATAQRWLAGLESYWNQVNADYYEIINECPAPLDWIAEFSIEAMRIANEQNRCLLLFSFPGGNPDMQSFNLLLPAYEYALQNECQPGRTHGIALHAYSMEDTRLVSESDVWVALRHRILEERLDLLLPGASDLPVYITELGIGGGTFLPPCEWVVRDAMQYTYQLEEDPYVEGFHLWNIGSGAQWYDITPCLPELESALINYYTFR